MNSAEIRQVATRECQTIREKADEEISALEVRAEEKVRSMLQELLVNIKPLQDTYAREGMLDEALAIRERIRQMRGQAFNVQLDPGHVGCSEADYGKSFLY